MGGCFGNDIFDRTMEQKLFQYLKESENDTFECENPECNYLANEKDWDYDEERNVLICPKCKKEIPL